MIAIIIAAILVAVDQITKFFILRDLKPLIDVPVWDGVLHLHYAENTGASFGMLPGFKWVFLVLSILFVIATFTYILKKKNEMDKFAIITLGVICGGALGNAIDRIRFGYVVDFIYVKIINFAIFNVADMCIVCGGILLAVYVIFFYKEPEDKKEKEENV